jgi:hypothetical protein
MWLRLRAVKAKRRRTLYVITLLLRHFAHRTVELTVRVPKKTGLSFRKELLLLSVKATSGLSKSAVNMSLSMPVVLLSAFNFRAWSHTSAREIQVNHSPPANIVDFRLRIKV